MSDREITVTLTEAEAMALVPQRGSDLTADDWNRRVDRAEDAQSKIRAALRALSPVSDNQESML